MVGGALTISLNPIWPILHSRVKLHQNKHLQLQLDPLEKENIAGKFELFLSSISVIARTQYAVFSCQICIWRACSAYQITFHLKYGRKYHLKMHAHSDQVELDNFCFKLRWGGKKLALQSIPLPPHSFFQMPMQIQLERIAAGI